MLIYKYNSQLCIVSKFSYSYRLCSLPYCVKLNQLNDESKGRLNLYEITKYYIPTYYRPLKNAITT